MVDMFRVNAKKIDLKASNQLQFGLLRFMGDKRTLIDPSNNLRGSFERSVIFTYSCIAEIRNALSLFTVKIVVL